MCYMYYNIFVRLREEKNNDKRTNTPTKSEQKMERKK